MKHQHFAWRKERVLQQQNPPPYQRRIAEKINNIQNFQGIYTLLCFGFTLCLHLDGSCLCNSVYGNVSHAEIVSNAIFTSYLTQPTR